MSQPANTVAALVEEVRKSTPPPEGRKARRDYASKEDFADLVGVSRSRIYAWTRLDNPEYPEEPHRLRLAELSRGRYQPDDFARPGREHRPDHPGELEAEVIRLARDVRRLTDRVESLERRARPSTGRAGKGKS